MRPYPMTSRDTTQLSPGLGSAARKAAPGGLVRNLSGISAGGVMPRRPNAKAGDRFQDLTSPPPAAFAHNRLAWMAGCDLALALHTLPIGVRHPRRHLSPEFASLVSTEDPARPDPDPDLVTARAVVDVLLAEGHDAACRRFNQCLASTTIHLPILKSGPPRQRGRKRQQGAAWVRRSYPGVPRLRPFFPPALAVWLVLSEPEAHPRLKRCTWCRYYFFARTRHRTPRSSATYCSRVCKSRHTSEKRRGSVSQSSD